MGGVGGAGIGSPSATHLRKANRTNSTTKGLHTPLVNMDFPLKSYIYIRGDANRIGRHRQRQRADLPRTLHSGGRIRSGAASALSSGRTGHRLSARGRGRAARGGRRICLPFGSAGNLRRLRFVWHPNPRASRQQGRLPVEGLLNRLAHAAKPPVCTVQLSRARPGRPVARQVFETQL